MGTLRLGLALAVVYGHAGHFLGLALAPGDTPVQIFFAISGFYMTLVLHEKYPLDSYRLFITNRLYRLFPSYLIVLACTIMVGWVVGSPFVAQWSMLAVWEKIAASPPQILLVGQDLLNFFQRADGLPFYWVAPVPQAWTLSLEIYFYALAPFIVRRGPSSILALIAASLSTRMLLQAFAGASGDPWSYRFFPSELALFLFGALAYQSYRGTIDRRMLVAVAVAIGACLLINRWNGMSRVASVAFLVTAICVIPMLFRKTKAVSWDRHLGELSYPVYICHFLPIWAVAPLDIPLLWRGLLVTASSLAMASALYAWVETPVDRWRQRRISFSMPDR